ncbi:hypothetical protein LTR37_003123 [Vermiconidia calcicola]|uniref:Uncharacterized protein n=1 Tax=Vermiconidia calcicola TaxID=1690605 RepID=A0ACC3NSS9_9PEZI|nr:hypothetical protein LTR37_003123 [Vermiconidia calcicola]
MAFSSQFSLSLELTRLLPLGSVATAGGRALIQLTRELRKSGSDIVVEEDLADIFGRNRIHRHFESSFRTAVQGSSIVQIPGLIDIVLEAGAGPTVRRSIHNRAYFASVIQLSLLTYTHDVSSLTKALNQALERRAAGSGQFTEVPDHDALYGTLGAIQDQSVGYRWDLTLSAVENKLCHSNKQHVSLRELRRLPPVVLQALLDSFTAIQHFPEQRLLRIRTGSGVSTIVAWAYHVLGLTTSVSYESRNIARFGDGMEQVLIQWVDPEHAYGCEEVALLNATDSAHPDFSLSANPLDDVPLHALCRHSVSGYGTELLRSEDVRAESLQRDIAHLVLALCIKVARKAQHQAEGYLRPASYLMPSNVKILEIGDMLFPQLVWSYTAVEAISNLSCLEGFTWWEHKLPRNILPSLRLLDEQRPERQLIPPGYRGGYFSTIGPPLGESGTEAPAQYLEQFVAALCRLVFALATVTNVSACAGLPLELKGDFAWAPQANDVKVMTAREAFAYLTPLLWCRPAEQIGHVASATLVSHNGWSLMLGSMQNTGPANAPSGITVHCGVPSRNQERRPWIQDALPCGEMIYIDPTLGRYKVERSAGQQVTLESALKIRPANPLVGVTYRAFEVMLRWEIEREGRDDTKVAYVRTGFREMQELLWNAVRIPACPHGSQPAESSEVPDGCVVFSGWWAEHSSDGVRSWNPNEAIHSALVAGSDPARWLMLFAVNNCTWTWDMWEGRDEHPVSYIRASDCCFPCAVERAKLDRPGFPKILIL